MRAIAWFILAYLMLGLQSGLAPYIAISDASPNLVLPLILFIALYAPRDAAFLSTYVVGLMQDVISQEPLGVHALVYSAVTIFVRSTQPMLYREHWLTHMLLALGGGIMHAAIITLVGLRLPPRPPVEVLFASSIYTAVLVPIILHILLRIRRIFVPRQERKKVGPLLREGS